MKSPIILYELAAADSELRLSPHCWKVRMALAHKGLPAEFRPVRFTDKNEIAFSGQGLVPVLVSGGEVICDSWRIALHLEERYSELPSLFGSADVMPITRFVNGWADGALLPAILRIILLDIYERIHEKDKAYFKQSREARFGMTLEAVVSDRPTKLADLHRALLPLRQILKDQYFLSGVAPAYADYCIFGMFMWARCTSEVELLQDGDPIYAWRERLLDAFDGLARSAPSAQTVGQVGA